MTDETYNGWRNRETWAVALFDWSQYDNGESPTRGFGHRYTIPSGLLDMREEIGSLWRVDWTEIGEAFLTDVREAQS